MMALKVLKMLDDSNGGGFYVALEFKLDFKKDALMAQKIIRCMMNIYCVESSFGYDEFLNEVLIFDYVCGKAINRILYDSLTKKYKHMVIKK